MNTNNHHVVIVGVPLVDSLHAPLAAPAVLKASLSAAGIKSTAIDLNIEILLKVRSHPEQAQLRRFFKHQTADAWLTSEVSKILFYSAKRILDQKPTIIALSLLTFECQNFTLWLCAVLRQLSPYTKIVIGGPGIKNSVSDINDQYRVAIKRKGLINDWIAGDGDQSLVEYVKENYTYPGINSDIWEPVNDLDSLPYPDYSDYNFFLYSHTFIPVVDSKGCVRNCEFCDVIEFWEKFKSRKAECIFNEMLYQLEKYNMYDFDFRSSITNGNLKEFKKLLSLMSEYNNNKSRAEQISWNASFIVRQQSQHPELLWQQMKNTNATLSIGVESVIPRVRKNLGKSFENEDIDYHLEMAEKYQVDLNMMLITGYPTETLEDYEFTKQWLRDRKKYNKVVKRLFLSPAMIIPETSLARNAKTYKIIDSNDTSNWYTTDIDLNTRTQYHKTLKDICKHELGFKLDEY